MLLYCYTANFRLILNFQFKGHIFECELRIADVHSLNRLFRCYELIILSVAESSK